MSTQRGGDKRTRPQKYKNRTSFKNSLHDTSHQTKFINSLQVSDVCARCKEIIEWKIKYKKYKPLTQPKKCVKCEQKTVKSAYHVMCLECGRKLGVCTKCCQAKEVVAAVPDKKEQVKLDGELQSLLQSLPERKRRTFIRYMNKQKGGGGDGEGEGKTELTKEDLQNKLAALKMNENSDDDDEDDDFFDDDDDESGDDDE